MTTDYGKVDGVAPAPRPEDAGKSPQELLREQKAREAEALARACVESPVYPERGPRCPRCGEKLDKNEPKHLEACPRCAVAPRSAAAGADLLPAGTWKRELLRGASYLPRGAFRLLRTPALWKYAVVPFILNVLVLIAAGFVAYWAGEWIVSKADDQALASWKSAGGFWNAMSYVVFFLAVIARVLAFIILPLISAWLLVAFPFNILYKIVFMPFMELLSEGTERVVLGATGDKAVDFGRIYANLVVGILDAILLTLLQGCLYLVLLPFAFIPIVGTGLWFVVPPAIFAGMDYSDLNLVRRGYPLSEKWRLWRLHEWRFLGFGISFFFLLTIPFLNAFAIPCAAVGGALLYLELPRK
jgi:CysZ protein